MGKTDARKLSTEAHQQLRNQVVRLRKQVRTYREIAEIIGVQSTTVCQWWKSYEHDGAKALRIRKRGRPTSSFRTLNPEQEKVVQRSIREKCPDQLKLPFALWTRIAVHRDVVESCV